ncbi:exonuclease SbcCD subunit D [Christensenella tenuis]|uniref:Nuclease SbcCD subunit D n=1 Tax=Christensenella tenuis TaxID=2763033 RepID=A0ABR7EAY0_9FIRM|nr:exonuclease SbcCD subunit D [Christensenella tenuis]MBC5646950.1 exonuclease SbcCD subunit D [Christensenella tenuis]
MRILHTSDWHLGITLNNMSLLEEQRCFLKKLYELVDTEKIDVIVIAGDVFDHAVSSADAIALYNEAMTMLCIDQKKRVLICAGNHDGAARLSSCNALLERAGLYVAGSVRDGVKRINTGDVAFHLLPYFSIDEVRYLHPEEEIKSYDGAMRTVIKGIEPDRERSNVLIAHCFVTGAQPAESDRSAMVGGANMVGADAFAGFDYVALGHLHRAQEIGGNIRYSGSPVKFSFAEADIKKSVTVVDTTGFSRQEIVLSMQHDLRVVKGNYSEILDAAEKDMHREDYLKIELRDEYAHVEVLNTLRSYYPRLLSLVGKQLNNVKTSLSMEKAASLHPEDILTMFCQEYTGEKPNATQMGWFRKALEFEQKGGDAQ